LGGAGPGAAGDDALEAARDRVWLKLHGRTGDILRPGLWRRSLSVPFPAAAAAAGIFLIVLGILVFRPIFFPGPSPDTAMAAGVDLDVQGIVPVSDMNGVLQYLGSQDAGDIVILRLPESRNFMSSGEPRIIRAAELPARHPRDFPQGIPLGPADYPSGGGAE
jgi:hypothetical protein